MAWYGVRSVLEHPAESGHLYEERIVIVEAADEDAALELASDEAREYCSDLPGVEPAGLLQSYLIGEGPIQAGSEVFSLTRTARIDREAYLDRFFDTEDGLSRG